MKSNSKLFKRNGYNKFGNGFSAKNLNPLIYEKTSNGEEIYDIYSRLLKERILFIGEEFTPALANDVVGQLLFLDTQNEEPIHIYINSYGGDLSSMFAIYDVMHHIKAPVCTIVLGTAASAAAVILGAGTPGYRYALPNSEIMIHQPLAFGIEGQVTDIVLSSKQMEVNKKKLLEILARHTGQTFEKIARDCERDFWLNPATAIKYGLIDAIKEPNKSIPDLIKEAKLANNKNKYYKNGKR